LAGVTQRPGEHNSLLSYVRVGLYTRLRVCTLAIYFRVSLRLPLVAAANRDEFLLRASADPRLIADEPWIVAGQDLVAGGTWFGVNQHRMVVGLLNRTGPDGPDPKRRSRGLLCLQALHCRSPLEVAQRIAADPPDAYNGFNLLAANSSEAVVATNHGDVPRIEQLEPGVHVLTNLDLNDPTCPRIAQSHRLFRSVALPDEPGGLDDLADRLRAILSDHVVPLDPRGDSQADTLCVHRGKYGTRSSSIVVCPAEGSLRYLHAPGPPCKIPYSEVALPCP
jgi:uncharacterized protein with NRDE domain